MNINIILIGLFLGLFGCTKAPIMHVYTLDLSQIQVGENTQYPRKTIKVIYPQSLRGQMSQKMNFSYSSNDSGTYQNSQWSNNMSKLLQANIIDILDRSKLFKAVLSDTTTLKVNYRLESNIFAFEHRVRGEDSHSVISIQFTLIDGDTGNLLKSKRFNYKESTPTVDARGYAYATHVLMARFSKDLVEWLR